MTEELTFSERVSLKRKEKEAQSGVPIEQTGPLSITPDRKSPDEFTRGVLEKIKRKDPANTAADVFIQRTLERLPGEVTEPVEKGRLDDLSARFAVSAADTFREKLAAFKRSFPDGDLGVKKDEEGVLELVFKENKGDKWTTIDAGFMEGLGGLASQTTKFGLTPSLLSLGSDTGQEKANETIADIVDYLGTDAGAIVGEALMFALPGGKEASILGTFGRLLTGNILGDLAQEAIESKLFGEEPVLTDEEIRKYREADFWAAAKEIATADVPSRSLKKGTAAAAFGTGIGAAVRGIGNIRRGKGVFQGQIPGARRLIAAEEALNLPKLPTNFLTDLPLVKRLTGQSSGVFPGIGRRVQEINAGLVRVIGRLRKLPKGIGPDLPVRLEKLEKASRRDAFRFLLKDVKNGRALRKSALGDELVERLKLWDDFSSARVSHLYNTARNVQQPKYDAFDLKDFVDGLLLRIKQGAPRGGENLKPVTDVLEEIKGMDRFVNDVEMFTSQGTPITVTSTDRLRRFAQDLWELKTPLPGQRATTSNHFAQQAFNKVKEVLDNPILDNAKAKALYNKASKAASERFSLREKAVVLRAFKNETPSELVDQLTSMPVENINFLKKALGAGDRTVNRQVIDDVFDAATVASMNRRSGDEIIKMLDTMDNEVKRALIRPKTEKALRNYANKLLKVEQLGIIKAIRKSGENTRLMIREIVENRDPGALDTFDAFLRAKGDELTRAEVRSGIIDDIFHRTIVEQEGADVLSGPALNGIIKKYTERGALKFLNVSDIQIIKNVSTYLSTLKGKADLGASMAAANAAQQARGIVSGAATVDTFRTLGELVGFGRWMLSPSSRKFFVGLKPNAPPFTPGRLMNIASGALGLAAAQSMGIGQAELEETKER
jgi:hypothetical protein